MLLERSVSVSKRKDSASIWPVLYMCVVQECVLV